MFRTSLIIIFAVVLAACGGDSRQTAQLAATSIPTVQPTEAGAAQAKNASPTLPTTGDVEIDSTAAPEIQEYPVPPGSHPHDVAPAADGTVWYTAQASGELGRLDPATGKTHHIPLGTGSAPHGVIVGPDGAAWVTDGGLNAIVRVDPQTEKIQVFPLPDSGKYANLNTAAFDGKRAGPGW